MRPTEFVKNFFFSNSRNVIKYTLPSKCISSIIKSPIEDAIVSLLLKDVTKVKSKGRWFYSTGIWKLSGALRKCLSSYMNRAFDMYARTMFVLFSFSANWRPLNLWTRQQMVIFQKCMGDCNLQSQTHLYVPYILNYINNNKYRFL